MSWRRRHEAIDAKGRHRSILKFMGDLAVAIFELWP
jgi:hypothetical protein